jgi:hypothetical protein
MAQELDPTCPSEIDNVVWALLLAAIVAILTTILSSVLLGQRIEWVNFWNTMARPSH